jgi:UDP-N-acetylmuramoyl-tripeptide--D-alanyl-D-alanine ligase
MQLNKQDLIQCLDSNLIEIKGNFSVSNYSIDTRGLQTGDTFVALFGVNDGHNYLNEAISRGALALIISQEFYLKNSIDFQNLIIVKDTLKALSDISNFNGEKFKSLGGKLIGITGSVGKTTLKEMLSFILSQDNIVSATLGNFNNHIGLPLSLAQVNEKASFGVFEMGMSSLGEISHLSKILKPQMAVITEIAEAHSEFFVPTQNSSSLDQIAQAKAEILDGMENNSIIFLNKDNDYFESIKTQAFKKDIVVYSFSQNNIEADIYVKSTDFKNYSMQVVACVFGEEIIYNIKSIAQHNAMISSLAFGIAKKLGVGITTALANFVNFSIPKGRGEISELFFKEQKIILIDDSYNANPKSMSSAILALKNVEASKILVLGDMLELGTNEIAEHKKLKEQIDQLSNIKEIILVGNLMEHLYSEIKEFPVKHFNDTQKASDYLGANIKENDLVFIKGSLGSAVHKISNYLQS